jgi:hypothetical protein
MGKTIFLYFIFLILSSCGIDSESVDLFYNESTLELVYPESDSEVLQGSPISIDQSELLLKWNDESEAMDYQLHLIEMPTSKTSIFKSNSKEISVILENGTRYKWFVSIPNSRNYSEIWSFNYIGTASDSLAPFPAVAVSPISGASISSTSTTVNLKWNAEDPDEDIVGYDLYFGEESDPPLLFVDLEENSVNGIPVEVGKLYNWKIVTRDSNGNESTSDIFNFTVG